MTDNTKIGKSRKAFSQKRNQFSSPQKGSELFLEIIHSFRKCENHLSLINLLFICSNLTLETLENKKLLSLKLKTLCVIDVQSIIARGKKS